MPRYFEEIPFTLAQLSPTHIKIIWYCIIDQVKGFLFSSSVRATKNTTIRHVDNFDSRIRSRRQLQLSAECKNQNTPIQ